MKKIFPILLLVWFCVISTSVNGTDRFSLTKTCRHDVSVESAVTTCASASSENEYIAVAGTGQSDDASAKGLRVYHVNAARDGQLEEMPVDVPSPSEHLCSVDMCYPASPDKPLFVVAGEPDDEGNVVWLYILDTDAPKSGWKLAAAWGKECHANIMHSVVIKYIRCRIDNSFQIAAVGKADENGVATVWLLKYFLNTGELKSVAHRDLVGGDLIKATWLPKEKLMSNPCNHKIPDTVLTVCGNCLTGTDKRSGNIHNFFVSCTGEITDIAPEDPQNGGVLTAGGTECTVRHLAWATHYYDRYPMPFLLAVGDRPSQDGTESVIQIYAYNHLNDTFGPVAQKVVCGKICAAQFTPACDCRTVTCACECPNAAPTLLTYTYDAAPCYPVEMTLLDSTTLSGCAHDTITSLMFAKEKTCWDMIMTLKNKGALEIYKLNAFKRKHDYVPCSLFLLTARKKAAK